MITYELFDNIHYESASDNSIIIDFNSGKFYELNKSSCHILEGILNQKNISSIIEEICQSFEISKEKATTDVNKYISLLLNNKIIKQKN